MKYSQKRRNFQKNILLLFVFFIFFSLFNGVQTLHGFIEERFKAISDILIKLGLVFSPEKQRELSLKLRKPIVLGTRFTHSNLLVYPKNHILLHDKEELMIVKINPNITIKHVRINNKLIPIKDQIGNISIILPKEYIDNINAIEIEYTLITNNRQVLLSIKDHFIAKNINEYFDLKSKIEYAQSVEDQINSYLVKYLIFDDFTKKYPEFEYHKLVYFNLLRHMSPELTNEKALAD